MAQAHTREAVEAWLIDHGFDIESDVDDATPPASDAGSGVTARLPPRRHRWVKLRLHVYICRTCGAGRVNQLRDGTWVRTLHLPDGTSTTVVKTPPCEQGARTERALQKYAAEIAAAAKGSHG